MKKIMPLDNIFFITNKENFYNVFNQIKELDKNFKEEQILVEPSSINTAPAITLSVKYLIEKRQAGAEEPIIFLPADHFIKDEKKFLEIVQTATEEINGFIGTIGITPTSPETGFGYIKKGEQFGNFYKASEFKEKPDKETAKKYITKGEYVWNSGIYLFNAKTYVNELKLHAPEIYNSLALSFEDFLEKFNDLPNTSIDFAISEKSNKVTVFEGDFGWSDIGSFDSLSEISKSDTKPQKKNHIGIDSKNVFVHSVNNKLIATLGVDDINVIENGDSILVQKRGKAEDVKKIVEHMKKHKMDELEHNVVSYRPWGSFEVLIDTPIYKVKKITVYPGSKLSLQSHYHRAEHWIVVKGAAKILNDEEELYLRENESTFIAPLSKHRLENPGKINLEMIEVQTGNYMGEDDIIRHEDIYSRT